MSDVHQSPRAAPGEGLPAMLLMAHDEVRAVLASLRTSRDLLEQSSVSRLRHTTDKLQEVNTATEAAATGILDGLDRSVGLVDILEALDSSGNAEAVSVRGQLRDELFQAQAALQFQDITAQQLTYASNILVDIEQRMRGLARALGPLAEPEPSSALDADSMLPPSTDTSTFDPRATMNNAEGRQALADEIFTG